MIKMAVMGCGRIGRMHAANIAAHPKFTLTAVYDSHAPFASEVAEMFGVPAVGGEDDIFGGSDIDAILVASATDTHADYIERAVAAGKPVLCEKPVDLSLERVNRCAAAIESTTVTVQIGFNRRFDPGHRAVRQACLDGEIGDLHQVVITSRDPAMPPRGYYETAGGLLRDMTIHDFDLARFLLNDEPTEVFAIANGLIDPQMMGELNDHDTAMIVMRTADGKQCHINNSRTAVYGYDNRLELVGSQGMLISDNRRAHEARRYTARATGSAEPYQYFFIERYHEAYVGELTAFADCIETGSAPEVGFEDGRRALILAEACYKSLAEGRLIKVDEVG